MTPNMKAFLSGLATLMEQHGITEMEVEEVTIGYDNRIEGIEFTADSQYDANGKMTREMEFFTLPGTWHNPESIREDAGVEKPTPEGIWAEDVPDSSWTLGGNE